ncbi:MAG: TonB-dependent receptor, partial [Bacteroidetes bacterium]|nr:TonB-dependent receptor [Bacteroidota bacterium]
GISPYYTRDESWSDNQTFNTMNLGYLDLKPFKFLSFRSEWSLNYSSSRSRKYESKELRRETDSYAYQMSTATPKVGVSGGINYGRYQTYKWTTNNYLTFDKEFGKHHANMVVGHSAESFTFDGNSNQYEGFPSDYFTLSNANTELVATRQSVSYDQYRFLSYFGRAKYSYDGKYHAEFQYRADGSSRFGSKNRWGYFPGFALGWVISEENFMKQLSVLNYLKIRASRGFVGNAEMGNYPYLSTLVGWGPYGGPPGFFFDRIGNDQIHWESQVQTNLGLDFTILNNRISGNFDFFIKDARDLIVANKIGSFHGYNNTSIDVNLGTLRNTGFDFGLVSHNFNGEFQWDTEFNISKSKSVVTKLSPNQKIYRFREKQSC